MTWVKICGITNEEDALLAIAMGADAIGFIFAQGSKRQVQPPQVADIIKRLPPEVLTLGVFRNDLPERVVRIVERCGLNGVQLHGLETPEQTAEVARRVPFVVKAFAYDDASLATANRYRVDSLLIDAPTPGSGETFDWKATEHVPKHMRWILAGGLHAGNVAEAVLATHPWGVDVASGVEASPGRKDPRLVREFIRAAKRAIPITEWSQRWPETEERLWFDTAVTHGFTTTDGSERSSERSSIPFDFDLDG
jgi:phosphoribosylanthranilate isomerase